MHILLVDDSRTIIAIIEEMVSELGEPTVFHGHLDPLEALQWCQNHDVDLLLVDYMMPAMNGLEFLRHFRQLPAKEQIPALMITANLDPQVRYEALQDGVNDFLNKPLDEIEFKARIRNMLQLRRHQIFMADQQEKEIRRERERLRVAQRVAQLGSWEMDASSGDIWLSAEHGHLLGHCDCQSSGCSMPLNDYIDRYVDPLDQSMVRETCRNALSQLSCQSLSSLSFEFRVNTANDTRRTFWLYATPMEQQEGENLTRLFGIVQDISQRKERESQLRKLSLAVEQSASTVMITDTDGNIEYVNPRFTEATGYTFAEVQGKNPRLLKPEGVCSSHYKALWENITAGRQWLGELRNRCKDGSCYWQLASIFPLLDDNGTITHYVGIGEDITAQKSLEESLRALNRDLEEKVQEETRKRLQQQALLLQESRVLAMGEMIGAIAHHWRQPLNTVGLMVQKMQIDYESSELSSETMARFVRETMMTLQTMSRVIDEFRDIFEPDCSLEQFSLESTLSSALKVVRAQMDNNHIQVGVDKPSQDIWIRGYPKEFQQVLLSVLGNAKDAIVLSGATRGRIHIQVNLQNQQVVLSIHDNGGGINPAIMDRIFEPYFTTKERGRGSGIITGTGIGLFMSKMIIEEKMQGKLSASNIDGGACFEIVLPLPTPPREEHT
ncbi:PAS domain S-box protein [Desulfurispirillum indicum]|uniref:histidine kinase n=1 Tax=Desulfurispirillum indicum (strain ATCC BAA-1389 / DSM 22839 / S5) TaxID=653733 RepID=E6W1K6_DESIS|nr:PAS domain S-box protein [Desulfurispirillum indicum]ADU66555.1 PAS sensor protein [Desulfurispirillum indicum S5]UCZ55876.1 PAS domain S-box protein [Desulfurispirillum indicum]